MSGADALNLRRIRTPLPSPPAGMKACAVGGSPARRGAPGRRFALSLSPISSGIPLKITLATACAAIALAITMSAWLARTTGRPAGAPHRIAVAGAPGPAGHTRPASPGVTHGGTDRLAAAAMPLYRTPRQIAWHLLVHRFHWQHWQFKYLDKLWTAESGWNRYATNPYSGAYGIPQAVPGNKMAAAGPDWRSSARTQIRWGMLYIEERYRTPYWAWQSERRFGWY